MKYSEKLQLPQWQEKRLRILQRDDFTCRKCNVYGKQVHAHHNYYLADKDPWDYPDTAFYTLCDECHKYEHEIEAQIKEDLFKSFKMAGFTNGSLIHIVLGLRLLKTLPASPELTASAIGSMFSRGEDFKEAYSEWEERSKK